MKKFFFLVLLSYVLMAITFFTDFLLARGVGKVLAKRPPAIGLFAPPGLSSEAHTDEFQHPIQCNSLGIRDRNFEERAPEGRTRILAIGDSWTFGYGVPVAASWPKQLERMLNDRGRDVEVINGGWPGKNLRAYNQSCRFLLDHYQDVDTVVLCVLLSDDDFLALSEAPPEASELSSKSEAGAPVYLALDGPIGKDYTAIPYATGFPFLRWLAEQLTPQSKTLGHRVSQQRQAAELLNGKWLEEEVAQFNQLPESVKNSFTEGNLNPFLIQYAIKHPDLLLQVGRATLEAPFMQATEKFLQGFKAICDEKGVRRVLVIPAPRKAFLSATYAAETTDIGFQVDEVLWTTLQPEQNFKTLCARLGMECVPNFEKQRSAAQEEERLYYLRDGHPTERGQAVLAECVVDVLTVE